jgi:DNA-directed RNA polymerase specialized sigma54-like protein
MNTNPFVAETIGHFGDPQHDALWQSLHEAAIESMEEEPTGKEHLAKIVFDWMNEEPRTTIVCAIVDKLNKNGFEIKKT